MLKVGLVGVGGISGAHIPAWERMEDVQLVALCDIRPQQLENHPNQRCYTDLDEMLRCEELDILDVCVPTFAHTECTLKGLRKGIHVVCEKPLSLNPEDAKLIFDTAAANGVQFMVAQVVRFQRGYQLLKELFDNGKLGKLLTLSMRRVSGMPMGSANHWMHDKSKSGHAAYDMHIHDLDFCIYAFGKPVKVTRNRVNRPNQDWIHGVYEFESGVNASIEAAWFNANYGFKKDFRAQFENGMLVDEGGAFYMLDDKGNKTDLKEAGQMANDIAGAANATIIPSGDGYFNELRYFADCVRDGKPQDFVQEWQIEEGLRNAAAFG